MKNGKPSDDADTERIDYPAEFCRDLRVELQAIDVDLGRLAERLPFCSVPERRSIMYRLAERLETIGIKSTDASGVVRDHVAALTLYLASR